MSMNIVRNNAIPTDKINMSTMDGNYVLHAKVYTAPEYTG